MNKTGIASSLAGVLILGAFVFRGTLPAPSPQTRAQKSPVKSSRPPLTTKRSSLTPKKKSKETTEDYPAEGPWKASRQHFAGTESSPCSFQSVAGDKKQIGSLNGVNLALQQDQRPASIDNHRQQVWCIPDTQPVRVMIAIAPDPAHTNLSLLFDRTLEALQLSAKSESYLPDRYWLPWDATTKTDWADYASLQQATNDQEQTEKQPGLLLFRWNGQLNAETDPPLLYVFLVGDTSTAGINGDQFGNAVKYIDQVCAKHTGTPGCRPSDRIDILGPMFSGSLDSLYRLAQASGHNFSAYSGTVSSSSAEKRRQASFQTIDLRFESLVMDTEFAAKTFIDRLNQDQDIRCAPPEVAILTETATVYGAVFQTTATDSATADSPKSQSDPCVVTFVYPREIASLRNASQAAGTQTIVPTNGPAGSQSPYLSLNLADQTNRSDEPPDFSVIQSPLSKEAVLMNYAAEMRREHYKYIGISATNVLDAVFLANFLRTAVPDARLFIFNSDLLFERDPDNEPYIGTLAITTYPLLLRDLDCIEVNCDRLPFADQYQQGQYNAGLLAIGAAVNDTNMGSLAFYGCDSNHCAGDLWLTVAGTGGYWPIRKLSGRKLSAPSVTAQSAQLKKEGFSGAWQTVALFLCAFALLQAGILLNVSPLRNRFRDFSLLNDEAGQRLFFIHVASASLALGLAMLGAPAWGAPQAPVLVVILFILGLAALVIACAVLQFNYVLRWKRDRASRPAGANPQETKTPPPRKHWFDLSPGAKVTLQVLGSLAVWIIAGVLAYLWYTLVADPDSDYGLFFGYRTLHMASGVSPFTPLLPLLAATYLWGLFEVWRLRFNDLVRPRLQPLHTAAKPVAKDDLEKLRPGLALETSIAQAVRAYWLSPGYTAFFIIIFLGWFSVFAPWHAFDLFERRAFGVIYEFLFCSVMALIISSGFRLAQIWTELHKLLRELKMSRLRFAFSKLKDHNWSPIWRQGGEDAEWSYMVQSFECLQEIANCESSDETLKAASSGIRQRVVDIRRALTGLQVKKWIPRSVQAALEYLGWSQTTFSTAFLAIQQQIQGLQNELAEVLALLLDRQQNFWEKQCIESGELEEERDDEAQVQVHCCREKRYADAEQRQRIERYVALRYTAFIRSVLGRIRFLLIFLAASFSLLMISLNVYSFEPHQALIWAVTAVFVVVGYISIVVLMQIHRDYILSRITGGKPNQLGWEFYVRIIALGVVPLLTLLSTHFPSIGRHLLSFLQPGLQALK